MSQMLPRTVAELVFFASFEAAGAVGAAGSIGSLLTGAAHVDIALKLLCSWPGLGEDGTAVAMLLSVDNLHRLIQCLSLQ